MNVPTEEQNLSDSFDRLASLADVPESGRARVSARLVVRQRRRRAAALATVAVVAGGIGIGVSQLPKSKPDVVATVDGTHGQAPATAPSTTIPDQVPTSDDGAVPNLTIELPGMPLTYVDIGPATETQPDGPPPVSYFQSFRTSADDWQLPAVYIYTAPSDASFSIGDEGSSHTVVDINGATGYLSPEGRPGGRRLGWRLEDGTTASVVAHGLSSDDLLSFARSMQPRDDHLGWTVSALPAGLVPLIDAPATTEASDAYHSLRFAAGDQLGEDTVELNSLSSTPVDFESRVADSLDEADTVESTTVRGQPAVIVRSPFDTRVFWYETNNDIENYIIFTGAAQLRVDEVIASLTELSSDSWDDLLASVPTPPN